MRPWLLPLMATLSGVGPPCFATADPGHDVAARAPEAEFVFAAGTEVAHGEAQTLPAPPRARQADRPIARALKAFERHFIAPTVVLELDRKDPLPWNLRVDVAETTPSSTRKEAGVGLAREIGESFRAGVDWRVSRNRSLFEVSEFDRHVVGLYFRLDLR